MDWLSWILTGIVLFYLIVISIKNINSLQSYKKVKDYVKALKGTIVGITQVNTSKNSDVIIGYPIYQCSIKKVDKRLNSTVCYKDVKIGTKATILYHEETGELWCQEDLVLLKKQIKMRIIMTLILLLVLIIESVLL